MVDVFRVGLLLTNRCNIACAHCWLGDTKNKRDMPIMKARSYIDQASNIRGIEWISFTGGEPFLLPKTLFELVSYASEKGFKTEAVTNCYWGSSLNKAEETLKALQNAGLNVINISCDDFHQRYIPFENVLNCYQAAKNIGLKIVIMNVFSRNRKFGMDDIVDLLDPHEIKIIGRHEKLQTVSALAIETGFIPVGRGANILKEERVREENLNGPCTMVLRDVGIDPVGCLLACCSASSMLNKFKLGNLDRNMMVNIIKKASSKKIFRILSKKGPMYLAEKLGLSESFGSKCHACYEIMRQWDLVTVAFD